MHLHFQLGRRRGMNSFTGNSSKSHLMEKWAFLLQG